MLPEWVEFDSEEREVTDPLIVTDDLDVLRGLSNDELKQRLSGYFGNTVESIRGMANCLLVAEERGMDMSDTPCYAYLRKVAHNLMAPELMLMGLKPSVMRAVSSLPVAEQKKLVSDGVTVAIGSFSGDVNAPVNTVKKSVRELQPEDVAVVFSGESIRTPEQQLAKTKAKRMAASSRMHTISAELNNDQMLHFSRQLKKKGKTAAQAILECLVQSGFLPF